MKQPAKTPPLPAEIKPGQALATVKAGEIVAATPISPAPKSGLSARLWSWGKWLAALIVVLAGGWYFGQNYILGPIVLVDQIKHQNVVQTVVASGQVQSLFQVKIGSQVSGAIRSIPVAEGQSVKKDDLLIQLDDSDAREAVMLAQGVTAQAQAKFQAMTTSTLPAAKEAQAQAQANLDVAQTAFDRADKLLKEGSGPRVDFENAQKALLVAQSQLRAANLQLTAAAPEGMDYVAAKAGLDQAIASQKSAEAKLAYYQIKAPFDGILITRSVDPGNSVLPGTVLMVLAPAGDIEVVVPIDEVNLGLLKLGQTAAISADAYPKQKFDGVLNYISSAIDSQTGSVQVKLAVAQPPDYLRQNMTVSVEIEVARRDNAIVVPSGDVHDLLGGKPWVYTLVNGRTHKQPITAGTIGDDAVEVIDGVKDGDTVLKGQATGVKDGQRVRVKSNA